MFSFSFINAPTKQEIINHKKSFYRGISRREMTLSRVCRKAQERGVPFCSADMTRDFNRYEDLLHFNSDDFLAVRAKIRSSGGALVPGIMGASWIS